MYPDLSYLFHDLIGTPVDNWLSIFKTFGLLLVLAILSAAIILYRELKLKAEKGVFQPVKVKFEYGKPAGTGELISNALWGFVLGYKGFYAIQHMEQLKQNAAEVLLSLDGTWWTGIALAALFAGGRYWESKKKALPQPRVEERDVYPHDRIGDITMIAAIFGVVGAKFFAVIEDIPTLLKDPAGTLLSGGGLAIYGGLIVGFLAVSYYLRRKQIPLLPVLDAVAPALIIAYGVGRLGCHLAGDGDWGIANTLPQPGWWFLPDWLWAYDYPHNVLNEGVIIEGFDGRYNHRLSPPAFPTPLYETTAAFLIGGILLALRNKVAAYPGMLFFIYLIFNGFERFWIEKIRVNPEYTNLGITYTQAELIAVVLFLIGVAGVVVIWRRRGG
ncbi:MAG: prolipoprotein diacylglyceryl transferase [Lewinellaceae bacterium]|nr:prolipoprotein diacylglyceryl transferase [Phaeodactylibacter sp.]MCB0611709.1 prolipoprotein diacylglyceryl transferase [Phaeodactylibacter sp.]MCB9347655.1 prolipoprotein diacylglyceryl transferase [Lewinellaceae bacterium]